MKKRNMWFLLLSFAVSFAASAADTGTKSNSGYVEKYFFDHSQSSIDKIEQVLIPQLQQSCQQNNWRQKWELTCDESALLIAAAAEGTIEVVEYLLSDKSNYNHRNVTKPSLYGKSALHTAAAKGHVQVMWFLMTSKYAQYFIKPDSNGFTALHMAAKYNQNASAQMLLAFHPELAFMEDQGASTRTTPQSLDSVIQGKQLACAIGAMDVTQVTKFVSNPDAWDQDSEQLLADMLNNKTEKDAQKINAVRDALIQGGLKDSDAAVKVLDKFATPSMKEQIYGGWKHSLLTDSPISASYTKTLEDLKQVSQHNLNEFSALNPGFRLHAPTVEAFVNKLNKMRYGN